MCFHVSNPDLQETLSQTHLLRYSRDLIRLLGADECQGNAASLPEAMFLTMCTSPQIPFPSGACFPQAQVLLHVPESRH